jgi:hypothetical protein
MDAMEIYRDIVSLCADMETCPHAVLPHVVDVPGMEALVEHLMLIGADAVNAFIAGQDDGTTLGNTMVHALILAAGVGYAVGAADAYDVTLASEVIVPDSLAAMDWLEATGMDGQGAD